MTKWACLIFTLALSGAAHANPTWRVTLYYGVCTSQYPGGPCSGDTCLDACRGYEQAWAAAYGPLPTQWAGFLCIQANSAEATCAYGNGTLLARVTRVGGPCPAYPENTTSGCNKTTADLYATMPPAGDLKLIFHAAQTCLSEHACNARCGMDNCPWLERVLPDFVGLYLRFERAWPQVVQWCDNVATSIGRKLAQLSCAGHMAEYHIKADLADALTQHGCGTESDWNKVFDVISNCETTGSPGIREQVYAHRQEARATCLYRRNAMGLEPFIEQPLRGQVCGQ